MNVLICNDDGINSPGIMELSGILSGKHEVVVFAPESERSACSSAMTIGSKLSVKKVSGYAGRVEAWAVYGGYPADCAKAGFFVSEKILGRKIDLLLSGINRGENTGSDIRYSGTVGAAFEGIARGVPSIAVSLAFPGRGENYREVAEFIGLFLNEHLPGLGAYNGKALINVNYPSGVTSPEVKYTVPADFYYDEIYETETVEDGFDLRLKGERVFDRGGNTGTDLEALCGGAISVSIVSPSFIHEIPHWK